MIEDDDAADEHDADGNDSDGHDNQTAKYYWLTLTNISFALNIHSYYKLGF